MNNIRTLKNGAVLSSAFTLMEVLVVLGIMGMIALIVTTISPLSARDQACYEATLEIMDSIEQALLGVPPTHLAGERRYMGYIADMGELPKLPGEAGQPAGLWTDRLAALYGAESDLPAWGYTGDDTRLWIGWHGPYLEAPAGVLRDGWGNPLVFERFEASICVSRAWGPTASRTRYQIREADTRRISNGSSGHGIILVAWQGSWIRMSAPSRSVTLPVVN